MKRVTMDDADGGGGVVERYGLLPCRWCGTATQRATLADFGARCYPCYQAYVREPQPASHALADKRSAGPMAWAHALRKREEAVERLTLAQRDMWRAAVNRVHATEDAA